jgi:hypothetical protein
LWAFGLLFLLSPLAYGQATTQPTTRPLPFIIGVHQQPPEDVPKWLALGVNTFVGHVDKGGALSKGAWEQGIGSRGGNLIDYPGDDVNAEAQQPGRLGFLQLDEPDLSSHVDKPGNTPAALKAVYDRCHATGLPVYLNLGQFDNQWYTGHPNPTKTDGEKYGHRAADGGWMAYGDVIGFDYYLATTGRAGMFSIWDRLIDRAGGEWSGGKPFYLHVETCTQGKLGADGKPIPYTADQFEAEVWYGVNYAKAKGYRLAGIVYFSHIFKPGTSTWIGFDGTAPDVQDRMKAVNAKLVAMFGAPGKPATPPTGNPVSPEVAALQQAVTKLQQDNAALVANQKMQADSIVTAQDSANKAQSDAAAANNRLAKLKGALSE